MKRLLEVCVDSLASAQVAIAGGADRLELCSALALGGLTPYTALLRQIRALEGGNSIKIRCLMRPRPGDFLYAEEELALLCAQIAELAAAGADGFVIGVLTPDGNLDLPALRRLLGAVGPGGCTLHRAIDVSREPLQTYRDAAELGLDTVLTSGAAASCLAGVQTLERLLAERDVRQAAGQPAPEVLIGAGVNGDAITQLRAALPGARAFHMSGKCEVESGMRFRRAAVPMGLPGLDEWHTAQTDEAAVAAARAALDAETE